MNLLSRFGDSCYGFNEHGYITQKPFIRGHLTNQSLNTHKIDVMITGFMCEPRKH